LAPPLPNSPLFQARRFAARVGGFGLALFLTLGSGVGPEFGSVQAAAAESELRLAPGRSRDALYAPHRDANGRFFTPWAKMHAGALRFLRWRLSPNRFDKSREFVVPTVANDGAYLRQPSEPPSLTWVGHATYVVHDGDDVFLTDPIWSQRALIPKRVTQPGLPIESIPGDAFAVISHNHYDHLDRETVESLPPSVGWYVPLGLGPWMRKHGPQDVTELDWWDSAKRGRWTITCLPSQHWSRRLGQPANETLWCAWLVDSGERRYFFAGDTGYFAGFAEYGRRFGPIDAAMLPIGAYAPRWFMGYQHLDPAQAYQAFLDLDAHEFFATHWGTFDLTDEPIDRPPIELEEAVRKAGGAKRLVHVPAIGQRMVLETR
jgi:N-acyl-phosphatidylethanolamine-hydrolysing phospholipase D